MNSRDKYGPASRDYDVSLMSDLNVKIDWYGSPYDGYTQKVPHRVAKLSVNNPWRAIKPPGLDPTARTLTHYKRIYAINSVDVDDGSYTYHRIGPENNPASNLWNVLVSEPFYGSDNQLRTEAILDALAAVKNGGFNAGVALAESEGVAKMVTDLMQLVTRTRQSIRKGDLKTAYRTFRKKTKYMSYPKWREKYWRDIRHIQSVKESQQIPSGWLYYHFGIKPTLNDIESAIDSFGTRMSENPYDYGGLVHGYAKETFKSDWKSADYWSSSNYTYSALRSVRVSIEVHPKNTYLGKLSSVGVTNPPEAVYNAIPFSWLLDYFTTFGDWLSVLDVGLAWNFADKWTESWRLVYDAKAVPVSSSRIRYHWPVTPSVVRYKTINRVVRGDLYGPMGSILPTLKRRGPSAQQYSNLLSVFASSMRAPIRP